MRTIGKRRSCRRMGCCRGSAHSSPMLLRSGLCDPGERQTEIS